MSGATGGDSAMASGGASGGSLSVTGGAPATGGQGTATGGDGAATGGNDQGTGGSDPGGCTPNPAGSSKDLGDGTFLDEVTCLMWMKDEWPNTGDFIGKDHAASCDTAEFAGHSDWRGPDAGEMSSLIANDSNCGMWNAPNLWNPMVNTTGFNEPVMYWTSTLGDGQGSDHQCAVNGNTGALEGGSRKNPYHVICVRGTSPVTGVVTTCTGTACDY